MTTHAPTELTPAQHGLWVTEQVLRPGSAHHLSLTVRFDGPLDTESLAAACARVTSLHPVLTARVDPDGPVLVPGAGEAPLRRLDRAPDGLGALLREECLRPFEPARGPLVRFTLITTGPDAYVLHVVAHHLVFDGMSKDILLAALAGATASLPDPGPPPAPGAEAVAAATGFWAARWHEPAAPVLPGLPTSVGDPTAPAPGAEVPFTLDAATHARLTATADALGVTRFELLLAVWHTLLLRYGDQAPVTALELSTRRPEDTERVGLYVNELPVFTHPGPDLPFAEFARLVRAELRAVYAHRAVPLGRAVRGLTPRTAIAPVSVGYRRRTGTGLPSFGPGTATEVEWTGFTHTVRSLVHLQLVDREGGLDGSLHHRSDAFAADAPARMVGHFRTLLDGVLADPAAALAELPLLTAVEREQAASAAAVTPAACPPGTTVMSLFAARVAAGPDAVAVVGTDGREFTYGQLDSLAREFAGRLREAGLGAGDLVGVRLARSTEQLVAVLGVLGAGAAYVPLDPGYPAERLEFISRDAGLSALVTDTAAPAPGVLVLAPGGRAPEGSPSGPGPLPEDPAYVIYTSGSTGTPKGVEVPHSALANLLATLAQRLDAGPADRWLGLTSLSFDISTVELLLPLTTGARVVLVPEERQRDGAALLKLIDAYGLTHAQATPSGWRLMLAAGLDRPGLVAVTGGEALPERLAGELVAATGRLVNVYGPTETTVWSTLAPVTPGAPVTIGGPLAATRAVVRDAYGQPVPDGLAGELHLGGAGVAHGYRGRPGLTAQRFVPDPYGPPGSRLYRTGDLVRRLPDGALEFAGRTDTQVKLRGHRVELGEIEARLVQHPGIAQAAVVLRHDTADTGGEERLVAYTVAAAGPEPSPERLRAHLARSLPAAMLPGAWVALAAFPLTPNGKLDRAALPEPSRTRQDHTAAPPAPQAGGVAAVVTEIWQEVLRLDDLGPDEDLFDLGGHSLTITAIAARIRKRLGVDVPLDAFFDTPTITGITAAVTELQQEDER